MISRCLVVGSGSIARRHIANLRQLLPDAEIACASASGRNVSTEETAANICFSSFSEALSWRPEMAVVASPAPLHLEHAASLLATGIAVLIEKPLSDSLARHDALAENLIPYRDRIEVAYNLRFLSSFQRMQTLLKEQIVGRLYSIHIDLGQYLPDWRPNSDYRKNVSANRNLGGGVLLELSHEFDYVTKLFGRFDRVFCITGQSGALDIDVEDSADILLMGSSGLLAQLHMDFLQRKATRRCKVIGQHGNLLWNLVSNSITLENASGQEILFSETDIDRNAMYLELLRGFINLAQGHARPRITYEEALGVLAMVDAMRQSAETGLPMPISYISL
ncbi:Gfo/Idh/MocA family protein [Herbaspirillum seropedicae]|uniref:Gfo/Idh/MocA family protein n=1 Tax=Herbaspirillum seropedicae TaxID=964 RepID=UPI003D999887